MRVGVSRQLVARDVAAVGVDKEIDLVGGGNECIPYCRDTIPQDAEYLRFYVELYNVATETDGLGDCNVHTCIRDAHTQKTIAGHSSTTKVKALNYYQFMKEIDIKRLPTGKYFLTIEIRDRYDKAIGTATILRLFLKF